MKIQIIALLMMALNILHFNYASNILVLEELPSPSHHHWIKSVTTALVLKGHNITIVTADEDTSTENLNYIHMDKVYETFHSVEEGAEEINFFEMGSESIISQFLDMPTFYMKICSGLLKSAGWQQLLSYPNDFKFDLIIHDYLFGGCLLSFTQKFKNVPLVSMTAFSDNFVFTSLAKSTISSALNPHPLFKKDPSNIIERTANFLMHLGEEVIKSQYLSGKVTDMIQQSNSFEIVEPVSHVGKRSILFLTNYDPAIDGPQILPPNVIGVGGLQIKPKKLPAEFQEIADNSTDGLILFSLGTNVRSEQLGDTIVSTILEVFQKFPQHTFLWKIDLEKFPIPLPTNVLVRKWIPQNDILGHKNTKVFITHGGLLSTQEAIWNAVPMLGIPVFADQFANVHRSVDKGIAEVLYLKDLSTETLHKKLQSLLTNPKFHENIQIISNAFRDQKETPLERAVWWIEWAIRNPNVNYFKSRGQHLNFLQIESVDVIALLTIAFAIVISLFLWILFKIVRCFLEKLFNKKVKAE